MKLDPLFPSLAFVLGLGCGGGQAELVSGESGSSSDVGSDAASGNAESSGGGDGDETSDDGDGTSGDGDGTSGDGDGDGTSGDGDGDGTSGDGDGDGTSGDGDGTSGDGDGTTGDGDGTTGDGDGTTGDGDGTTGDGDGTTGDGDGTTGDGDGTTGDGDGTSGDGDGDGTACIADPYPASLTETTGLTTSGYSQIRFVARDGNEITAYTYRSTAFDPQTGSVLFVMHGANRNASDYRDRFAAIAQRNGAIVIAPEFDAARYSGFDYTFGVGTSGTPSGESYDPLEWRVPEDYIHSELEHVFESTRALLSLGSCDFLLTGHSAGGQFTHRNITFRPDARTRVAVAMNPGWWTLLADAPPVPPGTLSNTNLAMPYGLRGTPPSLDREASLAKSLVVLLGTEDTDTNSMDPNVNGSPEAEAQGSNRLERGRFYFAHAEAEAAAVAAPFGFRTAEMPGAGHSSTEMAQSAGWFLFAPTNATPCTPSLASAVAIQITEIAVRPDGDANGDGSILDPDVEDEFVEIVNIGATDACLTGWRIGDVNNPERHRVAVGPALPPGGTLVVFGGGLPTGEFGGADVEWAAFSDRISLTNTGDVLSISDHQDTLAAQVSWGDCFGVSCASEHIAGSAPSGVSWARLGGTSGSFVLHDTLSAAPWSPGTDAAGQPF